jgi:hypothetical protein
VFSSKTSPTLHHALPALEALHKAWDARSQKAKYANFKTALEAGTAKIESYYNKTSASLVYTMPMSELYLTITCGAVFSYSPQQIVLDPELKLLHFKKH